MQVSSQGKKKYEHRFSILKFCEGQRMSQDENEVVGLDVATVDGMTSVTKGDTEIKVSIEVHGD